MAKSCLVRSSRETRTFRPMTSYLWRKEGSYRVSLGREPGAHGFGDNPFVGVLVAVEADSVLVTANDPANPHRVMHATRQSRPVVTAREALG